jgi:uncharacterized damage-inducible protein DinB
MATCYMSSDALLAHWQGHRRLTRKVIEAFPEDRLFTFSVGGMRPFGALAQEFLRMAVPMVRGVVDDTWSGDAPVPGTKAEVLAQWDEATREIDGLWGRIPPAKFDQTITAFGQYTGKTYDLLLYVVDNEIHHRGQGYVYLRALGIAPPPFFDRA